MIESESLYAGKSVFVTGAAGFIGSHLTEMLVRQGARVRALIRYNSANQWGWLEDLPAEILSEVELKRGDIRDVEFVSDLARGCDIGFHLAALISIPYSYESPRSYIETNISGTLNVLEAVRRHGSQRLVTTSTSEVYGTAQYVPIDEAHPLQGQSPYSATKIGADQLAESYFRSFGTPVVMLRPFNTYGPRQSMRAFIPNLIIQGLAGNEVRVGNLSPTRDLNYVLDTVTGFIQAGMAPQIEGEVINLGTGGEIAMQDLIPKVEALLGKPLKLVHEAQRYRPEKSEVFRLCADISKARAKLNYAPQYNLDQGLAACVDWFRKRSSLAKAQVYHV